MRPMLGLENLQIMPTSGEPPSAAMQAQQHRLEHALEDELLASSPRLKPGDSLHKPDSKGTSGLSRGG